MNPRNKPDTSQHILDVAEQHFALYGFAGTSLRGIIKEAKINVAAVAYHYGTKEDLYKAVVQRFAAPVVEAQLKQLAQVKRKKDLRSILKAFYLPPLKLVKSKGKSGQTLALFLGRMQSEPDPAFTTVDQQFASCRAQFIAAFSKCMKRASEKELHWKFEFMLSLIVCFLTRQQAIRMRYGDKSDWTPEQAANEMIEFCMSGMAGSGPV